MCIVIVIVIDPFNVTVTDTVAATDTAIDIAVAARY